MYHTIRTGIVVGLTAALLHCGTTSKLWNDACEASRFSDEDDKAIVLRDKIRKEAERLFLKKGIQTDASFYCAFVSDFDNVEVDPVDNAAKEYIDATACVRAADLQLQEKTGKSVTQRYVKDNNLMVFADRWYQVEGQETTPIFFHVKGYPYEMVRCTQATPPKRLVPVSSLDASSLEEKVE